MSLLNYIKQIWDTTSYFNPTRMNHIEDGIYAVSDKVDNLSADDIAYDSNNSVKDKLDKTKGIATEIVNTTASSSTVDIDISGYDELYAELRYYGGAFSTMTYRTISASTTYRVYGFVDSTTNFASAAITVDSNKHITNVALPNTVGASGATRIVMYGIKY